MTDGLPNPETYYGEALDQLLADQIDIDNITLKSTLKSGTEIVGTYNLIVDIPYEFDFDDFYCNMNFTSSPIVSRWIEFIPTKFSTDEPYGEPVRVENLPLSMYKEPFVVIQYRKKGKPLNVCLTGNPFWDFEVRDNTLHASF